MARMLLTFVLTVCAVSGAFAQENVCPNPPEQFSRDVVVDTQAKAAALGIIGHGEFVNRVETTAKSLLDSIPDSQRVLAGNLMYSVSCQVILQSETLTDDEKLERLQQLNEQILRLFGSETRTDLRPNFEIVFDKQHRSVLLVNRGGDAENATVESEGFIQINPSNKPCPIDTEPAYFRVGNPFYIDDITFYDVSRRRNSKIRGTTFSGLNSELFYLNAFKVVLNELSQNCVAVELKAAIRLVYDDQSAATHTRHYSVTSQLFAGPGSNKRTEYTGASKINEDRLSSLRDEKKQNQTNGVPEITFARVPVIGTDHKDVREFIAQNVNLSY